MSDAVRDGFELAETHRTLPIALLRTREAVMDRFRPLLAEHDVSEQQWRVMRVLKEMGEIDASQLADRAYLSPPSLTRMLRTLVGRGLIFCRRAPEDRRRMAIGLTAEGIALFGVIAPRSAEIYRQIETDLGRDRIEALIATLESVQTSLGLRG